MPVRSVSPNELSAMNAAEPRPLIIDVRTENERSSFGWIDGSISIAQQGIAQFLQHTPPDREALIIIVCQTGARSAAAARQFAEAGYTNIGDLSGGMLSWMLRRLPVRR
ncbi:MAG: rhodanese-like domain-containing protein [Bacteroidetes bacterium]|nr:rhodanese-like domain-containing protein [Bacteroidota bacterium]